VGEGMEKPAPGAKMGNIVFREGCKGNLAM